MMHKTELLAPAKDKQTAFSAIDCGADAVYIGAPRFGARKNVPNTLEDIKEVVDYAHRFWVKVFVTMNTILTDLELEDAVSIAVSLSEIGVDALIIQDLGLLERLMQLNYSTPIHMSTQCDNYLPEKVKFFNDVGVSRVILARECSLERIREIHNQNPDLELEAFVHGALCVSMSGQCYLSQSIGGRSANRGECAQPCRKKYSVETSEGNVVKKDFYALCLKDFNASNCLEELKDAGICSFKIEGRLKDEGYVKNIVAYYRQKLGKGCSSGRSVYPFTPNPEKSFNRGFTEYFLKGRTACFNQESPKSKGEYLGKVVELKKGCFKLKTDKIIHSQDGIYYKGDGFRVNRVEYSPSPALWAPSPTEGEGSVNSPSPALQVAPSTKDEEVLIQSREISTCVAPPTKDEWYATVYPNKQVNLKIGDELWRNYDSEFEKDLMKPVKRQVGIHVKISPSPAIQKTSATECAITIVDEDGVQIIKELPIGEKANNPEKMKENFIKQFSKTGESDFYIENIVIDAEVPFMPVCEINKLRRELLEELKQKRIDIYNNKIRQFQNPMRHSKYFLEEVDYRANVHNKSAKAFYEKSEVKVLEPSLESNKPNRKVILMRCKHCIKYALNMCKSQTHLVLRDEFGKVYPLHFDCKNCEMSVLSD